MYSILQTSTPPRIPPTINTAVLSTELLQENNMLMLKAGLNKVIGTAVLGTSVSPDPVVAGTVKVNNSLVSVGDFVFVTLDTPSGTLGASYCVPSATVLNGSFVIRAVNASGATVATDASTVRYMIVKPVA